VIDQAVKNVIGRATHKTIGAKIVARCSSLPGATEHVRPAAPLAAPLAAGRENGANPDYSVFRRLLRPKKLVLRFFVLLPQPLIHPLPRSSPFRQKLPRQRRAAAQAQPDLLPLAYLSSPRVLSPALVTLVRSSAGTRIAAPRVAEAVC